jgi:hypothetical protein
MTIATGLETKGLSTSFEQVRLRPGFVYICGRFSKAEEFSKVCIGH